jgi:DNA-directed RNA polymerase alpha subunit
VQKQKMVERQRIKELEQEHSSMKPLFEDILKQILSNLSQSKSKPNENDQNYTRSDFDPNQK